LYRNWFMKLTPPQEFFYAVNMGSVITIIIILFPGQMG
jgi:hypothetical protein